MGIRMTVETTFDHGEKGAHQFLDISRPYPETCPEGPGWLPKGGKVAAEQI
jgi:hypothetical protein